MRFSEKEWSHQELDKLCTTIYNGKVKFLFRRKTLYLLVLYGALREYINELWVKQGQWKLQNPTTDHDLYIHELELALSASDVIIKIIDYKKLHKDVKPKLDGRR
jgi:hypothetical protein